MATSTAVFNHHRANLTFRRAVTLLQNQDGSVALRSCGGVVFVNRPSLATAYRELLVGRKISWSMSAKGCCRENAVAEIFFYTLKHELGLDHAAQALLNPQQLLRQLAHWIECYYNRKHRHSTNGYLSPIDYEHQFTNTRTLSSVMP